MVDTFPHVSAYLSAGYTLTPLAGKIPIIPKWQNSKYEPFFSCEGNFGVVLQDEDLVIDIDPRNGGDAQTIMQYLPATFTVKTGGGGWHYYYKKPPTLSVVGLLKQWPGIEFKTKGQQVVGAGSITAAEYVVINGNPSTVNVADSELLKIITRREIPVQKTDKKIIDDSQQAQDRFLHYLTNAPVAISGQYGDKLTYNVACHGRDLGLSEHKTLELMSANYNQKCIPPWPEEELFVKVQHAYKYAKNDPGVLSPKADFEAVTLDGETDYPGWWEYADKSQTKLKPSFRNALSLLLYPGTEVDGLFRFNEFSEDIEFTRASPWHKSAKDSRTWTDADAVLLKEWMSNEKQFAPAVADIHEAVLAVAKRNNYHPVKDYFNAIRWDGTPRVKTWLIDYLNVEDNAYTRAVSELILCAAVIRVFKPGTKFDYMMVLEGTQGIGKSRVCKTLGGLWHIEVRLDPHNKDLIDYIRSKWIVEIPEMDVSTKAETNAIKAFLSRDTDRARLAYARTTKDFQRQSIFIGTYNPIDGESAYLKDPTGNRRFWPIKVPDGQIDISRFERDRDQLWAEALVISRTYDKDRLNWLGNDEADRICKLMQVERMEKDPWHNTIAEWVEANVHDNQKITNVYIWTFCLGGRADQLTRPISMRIGATLRLLGWEFSKVWDPVIGNSVSAWKKPKKKITEKSVDKFEIE